MNLDYVAEKRKKGLEILACLRNMFTTTLAWNKVLSKPFTQGKTKLFRNQSEKLSRVDRFLPILQVDVCFLCYRLVSRRCHIISTIDPLPPGPSQNRTWCVTPSGSQFESSTEASSLCVKRASLVVMVSIRSVSGHVSPTRSPKPAPLCSTRVTRLHRSYGCLRLPSASVLFLASYTCPRMRLSSQRRLTDLPGCHMVSM